MDPKLETQAVAEVVEAMMDLMKEQGFLPVPGDYVEKRDTLGESHMIRFQNAQQVLIVITVET